VSLFHLVPPDLFLYDTESILAFIMYLRYMTAHVRVKLLLHEMRIPFLDKSVLVYISPADKSSFLSFFFYVFFLKNIRKIRLSTLL